MANKGLQPVCLFLATFPSITCVVVVTVRVWMRTRAKLFGLGRFDSTGKREEAELTHVLNRRHTFSTGNSKRS